MAISQLSPAKASEQTRPRIILTPFHSNLLVESAYGLQSDLKAPRLNIDRQMPAAEKERPEKLQTNSSPFRSVDDPARANNVFITGKVIDSGGLSLRGITVRAVTSTGIELTAVTSSFGIYRFENLPVPETYIIRPISKRYRFSTRIITVTSDTSSVDFINDGAQTPIANAGPDQIVPLPNTIPLNGTATGGIAPLTATWTKISGPGNVSFANASSAATTATITTQGTYVLRLSITDAASLVDSDEVQVVISSVESPPPPNPVSVAPPIIPTTVTNIATSTKFLYTGSNPIQVGVNPASIEAERTSLLRGKVTTKAGEPISNVNVSILNHQEFGQTRTQANGMFDMVVNGGGDLTVKYEKTGFIPVHREIGADWQKFDAVDDVVMIPYDPNVTPINLASPTSVQVASGGLVSDSAGERRSRLFFKLGTTATAELPNGSTQPLVNLNVRSTEFTVGSNGDDTMPGPLPATSEYTYASEYSVDEAVALGATNVRFSQPVIQYLENFINFPTGVPVPTGSFNRKTGNWEPERSGRVIKILSITNGTANLDVNGNGNPATAAEYTELGINLAERQKLTEFYPTNQTLWRVPLDHFSPWDCNYPPANKPPPDAPPPFAEPTPKCNCKDEEGVKEEIQSQNVTESIPITNTGYQITYQSQLQKDSQNLGAIIPLVGPSPDPDLVAVGASIGIAGRIIQTDMLAPSAGLTIPFTWDGKDEYGRTVQGKQTASIEVAHFYPLGYTVGNEFGQTGNGTGQTIPRTGTSLSFRNYTIELGGFDRGRTGLGGWAFNIHHAYDPITKTLIEGNGSQRSAEALVKSVTTTAGQGQDSSGFSGDGGPARSSQLASPSDVAFAADGTYYIADTMNNRVRRVSTDGIISTFAGNGIECSPMTTCGDNGQATAAQLFEPRGVAVGTDGSVYISDSGSNRLRKVAPNGVITTIAGTGAECDPMQQCGDGSAATQGQLNKPGKIHLAVDGSMYIADTGSNRVKKISTNGIIRTIAGSGGENCPSDKVPALIACIERPTGVALASNGALFITANAPAHSQTVRLDTDGTTHQIADGICNGARPAGLRSVCNPVGVAIGPDGNPYVASSGENRILRYGADGEWEELIGSGSNFPNGEGQPDHLANIGMPQSVVFAPNGDIFIAATGDNNIRRSASPLPGYSEGVSLIASEDGSEVFQFNSEGRHERTYNALTGTAKYTFGYDGVGNLTSIMDGNSNVTTIERDGSGKPTGIRSPYGQLTTLTTNSDGYLTSVTNPAGESNSFTYSAGGLMLTKRDPRNTLNTFTYNATGRLIKNENSEGGSHNYTRTGTSQDYTVTHKSPLNRPSTFRIQNAADKTETQNITFEDGGLSQVVIQPDGSSSQIDPDGTSGTSSLGPDPRWAMQSPLGISESAVTPAGRSLNITRSRVADVPDAANPLVLTSQTDSMMVNGKTYGFEFLQSNRRLTFTTPLNRTSTYGVDSQERVTRMQFGNLDPLGLTYDGRGRLSSFTTGSGSSARTYTNSFNSLGYVESRSDPLNRSTSFQYDLAGRTTLRTLADGRAFGFSYDANGNLTSLTPPGQPAHTMTYNARNLITSYVGPTVSGNSSTSFTYNADSDLTRVTRPDGLQVNYGYNSLGQLQSRTMTAGTNNYSYDSQTGQLSSVAVAGGVTNSFEYDGFLVKSLTSAGTAPGTVAFGYNGDLNVSSISVNGTNAIDYTYDNDSFLTGAGGMVLTRNGENGLISATSLSNVTDTFTYNSFGEPETYSSKFNTTTLYSTNLTYDKVGRVSRKVEAIGGVSTTYDYAYDQTNRLSTVTLNGGPQPLVIYGYDSNDNRTSTNMGGSVVTGVYDAQDRLTNYGSTVYGYNANGDLQSKTVSGAATNYNYDAAGNLRRVSLPSGTTIDYVIDGMDRRVGKRVNGTLTQGFLYQGQLQIAAELTSSGAVASRFVYASRSNVPDFMLKNGQIYRLIYDNVGSVRLVVDVSSGNVAQRIDYDEFGVVLQDTNPGFQPFGFAGGLYDPQTKLVRFGTRDYDPEAGRWTLKDPILFAGGEANLYRYCANDPINFVDPDGRDLYPSKIWVTHGIPHTGPQPPDPRPRPTPKEFDTKREEHLIRKIQEEIEELKKKLPDCEIAKLIKRLRERITELQKTIAQKEDGAQRFAEEDAKRIKREQQQYQQDVNDMVKDMNERFKGM
ncbi:MAG: RHS repeat-associated core domain-containing protein [Pyrinomonadaceae bacterium]